MLREIMRSEPKYINVHAAEALIELGLGEGVYEVFLEQQALHGDEPPYRVVIWRVLSRSSADPHLALQWTSRIEAAFLDDAGPDRLHAVEALAKLHAPIQAESRGVVEAAAFGRDSGLALFSLWWLAQNGDEGRCAEAVVAYLSSDDAIARLRAGYLLRQPSLASEAGTRALWEAAAHEPTGTITHAYLVGSAYVLAVQADQPAEAERWRRVLVSAVLNSPQGPQRAAGMQALASVVTPEDAPLIETMLRDPYADARVYAAAASLRLWGKAQPSP